MNAQLIKLRKKLCLSQEKFAESINLKRTTIAGYENAERKIPERTIADICRVHNVNEHWLRTGIGNIFNDSDTTNMKLSKAINLLILSNDEITKQLFIRYLNLPPEFKKQFQQMLESLLKIAENSGK